MQSLIGLAGTRPEKYKVSQAYPFAIFRILLGFYLLLHFGHLTFYAPEIFSSAGLIPQASMNFTYGAFPNLLYWLDSPAFVIAFVAILALLSVALLLGVSRRVVALLLWYGWACLFNRNNLISNPGLPMVGWVLLACAVIPAGEPLALGRARDESWRMPKPLFFGAWAILAISYTISGVHKLTAPSWVDGTAMVHLMNNPLARDSFLREFMLSLPLPLLKLQTWGVLAIEIFFLPLALFHWGRLAAWLGMTAAHLGILCFVSFADLTFGVLMMHFFTFDPSWIRPRPSREKDLPVIFFDGVCGLCDRFVSFLVSEDHAAVLKYTPLQGETAARRLDEKSRTELSTVILVDEKGTHRKSDAVLRSVSRIGGIWGLARVFLLVPRFVRDRCYDFVAANRYAWFGKHETCRLPSPAERERFLP